MKNRIHMLALAATCLALFLISECPVQYSAAQTASQSSQEPGPTTVEPIQTPRGMQRHFGPPLSFNVERGVKVSLGNRTTGRITINGWDRNVIQVHAVSERGHEVVIIDRADVPSSRWLFLKADYANLDQTSSPNSHVGSPPQAEGGNLKVHLEINLPRDAEIEVIRVWRSDVQVTGLSTSIMVAGDRSSVILRSVGSATVQTRSGNVEIDEANGAVEVATTSGAVRINGAQGSVRVVSIAGPIEIKCTRGRIDVTNTEAPIDLVNANGDVEAIATNSSVRFTGRLRDDGRYNLKSLSGRVEMILPADSDGFDATLSSYRGIVETDFKLDATKLAHSVQKGRLVGRFGKGNAQITLDSFDGLVRLTKITPASLPGCN